MSSSLLRKGAWTAEEDMLLKNCIEKFGEGKWHLVPHRAGLNRCRKSCRLRWLNYLRPNIKRGDFGEDEVDLMVRLHKLLGNRWSLIAGRIPGRTANDIKNYWNTHLRSRPEQLKQQLKDGEPSEHTMVTVIKPQLKGQLKDSEPSEHAMVTVIKPQLKGQLKDGEPSEHAMVTVIKPQPHTISKGLNLSPHITTCDTHNMITSSSMDGIDNAFNLSPELLLSPTLFIENINNGNLDELFDNPQKQLEINDQVGWSFERFSVERDRLDDVELVDP